MVADSTPPVGGSAPPPPGGGGASPTPFAMGGGWDAYEQWMGKENFAQFQKNLCQAIVQQIGKDKEKEHEAALELQRAEKGEDMYENT